MIRDLHCSCLMAQQFQSCSPQLSLYWWSALPSSSVKFPPMLWFICQQVSVLCISEIIEIFLIFWWSSNCFLLFWVNFIPIILLVSLVREGKGHTIFNYSMNSRTFSRKMWLLNALYSCISSEYSGFFGHT